MKISVKTIIVGLIVVALIIGAVCFFIPSTTSGAIVNGYWDEPSQECWAAEDKPAGEEYPAGDESMFASCCFNDLGDQVDCNNAANILRTEVVQSIYGIGGASGTPGIFAVSHTITLTNDGSVPIDNIWVDSAVWSPSNSELVNEYAQIIGSGSSYAGSLSVGNARSFPTGVIDLTALGGASGIPFTYDLNLRASATAYAGELTSSRDVSGQITVENEAIGFSIDINWGA